MGDQKEHMVERFKNIDMRFALRVLYCTFAIVVFIITIMICMNAPVQRHFKNLGKNDVWFGDGWHYTDRIDETGNPKAVTPHAQHYLLIDAEDGYVSITKTLDFTPVPEEYLCFRARALDTIV